MFIIIWKQICVVYRTCVALYCCLLLRYVLENFLQHAKICWGWTGNPLFYKQSKIDVGLHLFRYRHHHSLLPWLHSQTAINGIEILQLHIKLLLPSHFSKGHSSIRFFILSYGNSKVCTVPTSPCLFCLQNHLEYSQLSWWLLMLNLLVSPEWFHESCIHILSSDMQVPSI